MRKVWIGLAVVVVGLFTAVNSIQEKSSVNSSASPKITTIQLSKPSKNTSSNVNATATTEVEVAKEDSEGQRSIIDQKIVDALGRLDSGDVAAGLEDLKAIALEYPNNQTVLEELGMYFSEKEDWDQALIYLQKLIAINPDNAVAIHELAQVIEAQQEEITAGSGRQKALSFLQEQRKKNPTSTNVISTLADYYAKDGKFELALPLMEEIIQKKGGGLYELETIGNVYADQGNPEKAIHYLNLAKEEVMKNTSYKNEEEADENKMIQNRLTLQIASSYIKKGTQEACQQADEALKSLHPMPFEMSSILIVNEEFEKNCKKWPK